MELPSCYCLHDDHWFLGTSIDAVKAYGPVYCFVSTKGWNGSDGPYQLVVDIVEAKGAKLILGKWDNEASHRKAALEELRRLGYKYVLIPDGDEIPEPKLIETLIKIAEAELADIVRVRMDTYFKSVDRVVRPRESIAPVLLVNCQTVRHEYIREYKGEVELVLPPECGVLHHVSYGSPTERIVRKLETSSHRDEFV